MKKILTVFFLTALLSFSVNIYASAENVNSVVQGNVGLTETPPEIGVIEGITPYSTQKPKETWNLSQKGKYPFAGAANHNSLYTDYLLTGKKSATLYVKNTSNTYNLKVSFKQKKALLDSEVMPEKTLKPGESLTYSLTLDTSGKYYLLAKAPSKFEGYIK